MIGPSLKALGSLGQVQNNSIASSAFPASRLGRELKEFLDAFNGLLAYESALWMRSATDRPRGLTDWNGSNGWRHDYEEMATGLFFFAEDVFGAQFAAAGDAIVSFDPETGQVQPLASGFPLAHEWQLRHRPLAIGERLIPKVPFVLGGEFTVDNLFVMRADRGMKLRANLAVQIRDLPDGTEIEYSFDTN
jgi:hypothetical protein